MAQTITSKGTSINTINKIYKILGDKEKVDIPVIFDYGCGAYDSNKNYAMEHGYHWIGFDPYNRTESENYQARVDAELNTPDIIICSNVLNVINDDNALEDIIKDIDSIKGNFTDVYFTIYEGDKSGIGKETSKGYQRNEKTDKYMSLLRNFYSEVNKSGNIIHCFN